MYGSKMCPRLGIGGERARDTILCGGKDKKKNACILWGADRGVGGGGAHFQRHRVLKEAR